jgi:hypothetical protein
VNARRLVAFALLVVNGACAATGSYTPRTSPRIAVVDGRGRTFARDGRTYSLGLAGSAEDLVAGNAVAVDHARRYRRQMITGLTLAGLGVATFATGATLGLGVAGEDRRPVGAIVAVTSIVPNLVSLFFTSSARQDLENAVNIYNDGLDGPIAPDAFDEPRGR